MIKTIPKKKKWKKTKWLSEEALKIGEKRREAKGKGEKERYTHLNAEFQRIARTDKKVSKFGKLSSGHRAGKGQFSFQSQRKAMPKKCSNYRTIALISHSGKVMLKILQSRLQQYMN